MAIAMSKAVTQGRHWIPRQAEYSMYGQRNGRVDVLPPSAQTPLYDVALQLSDAKERLERLRAKLHLAQAESHRLRRIDQLRDSLGSGGSEQRKRRAIEQSIVDLEAEMSRVRRHMGQLRGLLGATPNLTLETIFLRLAQTELPDEVFDHLLFKARAIVARAKGS